MGGQNRSPQCSKVAVLGIECINCSSPRSPNEDTFHICRISLNKWAFGNAFSITWEFWSFSVDVAIGTTAEVVARLSKSNTGFWGRRLPLYSGIIKAKGSQGPKSLFTNVCTQKRTLARSVGSGAMGWLSDYHPQAPWCVKVYEFEWGKFFVVLWKKDQQLLLSIGSFTCLDMEK